MKNYLNQGSYKGNAASGYRYPKSSQPMNNTAGIFMKFNFK
jgi:hypothetical protein